ncbi:MAG TPA: hypothetical protein VHG69_02400, partial [Thermoleophilaceae bacterium]|nr:hypothetical protein [Thermoleophilaceae bacterium]
SGSASGGGSPGSKASGSGEGGSSKAGAGNARAAETARAAGKSGADTGTVLAAQDDRPLTAPDGEGFSGAVTTSPNTGVAGDPELPFTGFQTLLLLAMGAVALAGGMALRTAARRRHAG